MPFCRKCGTELEPDDQFCPNCGTTYTPGKTRTGNAVKDPVSPVAADPPKAAPQPAAEVAVPTPEPVKETQTTPTAPVQGKHVFQGYVSIIVAIAGLGAYFIPVAYSDRFWIVLLAFFIEAVAVSAGSKATERGDKLGTYALIIAAVVILLGVVGLFVT